MTSITDALGGVVSFAYDNAGQLTTLTDPLDESWTYTYDALGNRASVTDLSPTSRSSSTTPGGS